jgi:hypothetical protein
VETQKETTTAQAMATAVAALLVAAIRTMVLATVTTVVLPAADMKTMGLDTGAEAVVLAALGHIDGSEESILQTLYFLTGCKD